jgi:hypothetical protein
VSGIEPRELYSQLVNTQNRLLDAENQLVNTQNRLLDAENQLVNYFELRSKRLHPFVSEALGLVASDQYLLKTDLELETQNSIFTEFGSDKDTRHSYGAIYFEILGKFTHPRILEIGVGSVNNFPYAGLAPGGGLKALRKKFPDAKIVGLDIDPQSIAIIKEQGFIGFEVDQTSDKSLSDTKVILKQHGPFDFIIDDGFHDPHANIRTLKNYFELLSENGTYVIEDIHESLIDFWKAIAIHLPGKVQILDMRVNRPKTDDNILILINKS